ncbi:MAG: response regulator [Burkholderiales bacterium]|nr:response regulator [Burkholderiales bacterium]
MPVSRRKWFCRWPTLLWGLAPPMAALAVQSAFWTQITPYAWLLFYPALFAAAWRGGWVAGIVATVASVSLVAAFFTPSQSPWALPTLGQAIAASIFLAIGLVVSLIFKNLRQTADALRHSEELLRAVIHGTSDAVFVKDRTGRYLLVNPACAAILHKTPEQILGHDDSALFPPETARRIKARDQAVMAAGITSTEQEQMLWPHGAPRTLLNTKGPLRNADGQVIGLFGVSHDITDIAASQDALQAHQDHLEQAVQQRTAELASARQESERLSQVKGEFLATMSHEIRTPLNAVLGLAQIGHQTHDGAARRTFAQILDSGRLLLGIINDILDFSKIEAGKLRIESIPVDLQALLTRATAQVRERAQAQGIELRIHLSDTLPSTYLSDPLRLEQILLNLLSNAVKFTSQGQIGVSATTRDRQLVLTVSDTGIGMSAQQAKDLFRPFEQADSSTTRQYGGTGLGLSITKRLVDLLAGEIQVHSEPGQGTRIDVVLPLTTGDHLAPPSQPALALEAPGGQRLAGVRVLAAEDNPLNQLVLREFLTMEGALVTFADNGLMAIDCVERHGPDAFDVVLMDIQMPGMDGYGTTRRLTELDPRLPVIGQSAHAMSDEHTQCLAAGMLTLVVKPLDLNQLVQTVLQHARPRPTSGKDTAIASPTPSAP